MTAHDRALAGWLFIATLALYLLSAGGHFYASDDLQKLGVLEAVFRHGTLSVPGGWALGPDGRSYAWFPLGASLVMLPGYLSGLLASQLAPQLPADYVIRFAISFENSVITAALVTAIFACLRRLGHGARASLLTAALAGTCTMLWPYAKTSWSEPAAGLALFLGLAGIFFVTEDAEAKPSAWLLPAACLAAAAFIRLELAMPAALAPAWAAWRLKGSPHRLASGLPWVLAPFGLVAAATLWYNAARFGSPLAMPAYGGPQAALAPKGLGRVGWALGNAFTYTLSPSQGLVWFSPPALLGLLALPAFTRRHRALAGLLGVSLLPLAAFYVAGWGLSTWSWGLRFAYVFVPALMLPVVLWVEGRRHWALGAIVALGLTVQLLGVLHNPLTLYERALARSPGRPVTALMADPAESPLRLAVEATPGLVDGLRALLTAPERPLSPAEARQRRETLPDLWYVLQLLGPIPKAALALAVTGLIGLFAFAVTAIRRCLS